MATLVTTGLLHLQYLLQYYYSYTDYRKVITATILLQDYTPTVVTTRLLLLQGYYVYSTDYRVSTAIVVTTGYYSYSSYYRRLTVMLLELE